MMIRRCVDIGLEAVQKYKNDTGCLGTVEGVQQVQAMGFFILLIGLPMLLYTPGLPRF